MLKNARKYLRELKLEIDYDSDCSEAMEAKFDMNMWKEKMQQTRQILFEHSATTTTTAAQAAATMTATATTTTAMIPRTAIAAKKNATEPIKEGHD